MTRKSIRTTYDQKCYDLAEHFLDDAGLSEAEHAKHADLLAQDIQVAIENYLSDEMPKPEDAVSDWRDDYPVSARK